MLRTRLVQHMELLTMAPRQLDEAVSRGSKPSPRSCALGDECVHRLRARAEGSLQLAAHDFARNRYLNRLEIDGRLDGLRPYEP